MDLNLRGIDGALVGKLKRGALDQGKTLKEYCVEALSALVESDSEKPTRKPVKISKPVVVVKDPLAVALELAASGIEEPETTAPEIQQAAPARSSGCPSCGALGGVHQRGCKGH